MVLNILGKRHSTCIMLTIFLITELGRHQPQPPLIQMANTKAQGGVLAFPTIYIRAAVLMVLCIDLLRNTKLH